jgi:uncharacterized protein (DUF433 family)
MAVADDLLDRVAKLPSDEREELISRFSPNVRFAGNLPSLWSNIVRSPDVCGGSARIIRTRIPVWLLEQFRRLGTSEAELLKAYPTLRAIDLVEAWNYADAHGPEMDHEIRENEED